MRCASVLSVGVPVGKHWDHHEDVHQYVERAWIRYLALGRHWDALLWFRLECAPNSIVRKARIIPGKTRLATYVFLLCPCPCPCCHVYVCVRAPAGATTQRLPPTPSGGMRILRAFHW